MRHLCTIRRALVVLVLAAARLAAAAPGDTAWSHMLFDTVYATAAADGRLVYTAGHVLNDQDGTLDLIVDAWDPVTGAFGWRNQYDSGHRTRREQ